jgi:hypothetical protein
MSIIPIARTQFTKTSAIEDPLLKVPPARRGNRTRARFPSRSAGNLQEGGNCKLRPRDWYNTNCTAKVRGCTGLESPLTPTLSPLDKGGEGREWGDSARAGICELWLGDWYNR